MTYRLLLLLILFIASCGDLPFSFAEELTAPVDRRFAKPTAELPDLQRHVLPLLGRLGCNSRECHGSFQGQGGFRLSLFGYDFTADHAALVAGEHKRVKIDDPAASLILQKPTLAIDHEGGERFKRDSWEYRLLHNWIVANGPPVSSTAAALVGLEVEPQEIRFNKTTQSVRLQAFATWSDGTREDVTPLCRFRSNDESVAKISTDGTVTSVAPGDTHVVVFYDNGITPVPVLRSSDDSRGLDYPVVPTPTKIDELVVNKLRKLAIVPSELCTDAEFLRRISLDLTATLPTPAEIEAFLADESADKRVRKIEELLARPTYAAWWATRLCDLLGNSEQNLPVGGEQGVRPQKTAQWYDWLYRRLDENMAYDQIAAGIVLAAGRQSGQSVEEYYAEMSSYFLAENPADFSQRETMPYFWTRGRFTPPQALRFSYAFLGVRLECAQCHKHPYDQWTKDDYDGFQAFFGGVSVNYSDRRGAEELKKVLGLTADQDSAGYKKLFADLAAKGEMVPWQEVTSASLAKRLEQSRRAAQKSGGRVFTPKLLGGDEIKAAEDDCRAPLMHWLRQADNPYFAKAMVNRIWAGYFGVGIVDPPDDMNLANPPSNEPLLNYLAEQFIAHGYDLKWLHREIAVSRTYQASWRPNETNRGDERNFSHALVRRLPAEVTYDAFVQATANDQTLTAYQVDPKVVRQRAIGVANGSARHAAAYATRLFGKPNREGICDCDRSNEPSLLQTIYLRNDAETLALINRKEGWLRQMTDAAVLNDEEIVLQAYLRTFGRPSSLDEAKFAQQHLQSAKDRTDKIRDLLWALLNSKEFLLNH